jgi:ABC-type transport system involved in multi-copper enzyme maturation permease subunit
VIGAVRAELAKVFTVRLWWILLLVLFAYVAVVAGALAGVFGTIASDIQTDGQGPQGPPVDLGDVHLVVYSTATAIGYVFPVLLGALATTSEFRYQTLTPTFLADPRRGRVLAAKLVAMAVVGAVYGVVSLIASIGVGAAVLEAVGQDSRLDDGNTWVLAARVILAMVLWAVIGVGLGSIVPNQVAVIVIVLAFTQFVEPLLRSVSSIWEWTARVGQFLPGSASDALVGWSVFTSLGAATTEVVALDWWQGGLVLLGIAVVAAGIGYLTTWKRDVT